MIDLELFDKWLKQERYIKLKKDRNKIISTYKKSISQNKTINEYQEELEKIGWDEITTSDIANYILFWNHRVEGNQKVMNKEEDYKYIKKFMGISLVKICEELKVNYSNVVKGRASLETTGKVREALEKKIKELGE